MISEFFIASKGSLFLLILLSRNSCIIQHIFHILGLRKVSNPLIFMKHALYEKKCFRLILKGFEEAIE